jgi:hypothetical protein
MKWEIATCGDPHTRNVLATDVDTEDLWAYFVEAGESIGEPYTHIEYTPEEKRALARVKDMLGATDAAPSFRGPRIPGIMVTRMDQTPEAKLAKWDADFYDRDRRGYKRRRFKKPQIERDWEAMLKEDRKDVRDARAANKVSAGICPDCGFRWDTRARNRGLIHVCGTGLVSVP